MDRVPPLAAAVSLPMAVVKALSFAGLPGAPPELLAATSLLWLKPGLWPWGVGLSTERASTLTRAGCYHPEQHWGSHGGSLHPRARVLAAQEAQ